MSETTDFEKLVSELEGSAEKTAAEMEDFRQAAAVLSSEHTRLIDEFAGQWIGVFGGEVLVQATTLKGVIGKIEEQGLPRERVIVRYIDKNQKTLIL